MRYGRLRLAATIALCALFLACAMGAPGIAYAEVHKSDIVVGSTVEERNLSVSECPSITAQHAALISGDGHVYFMRDAETPAQIASVTKVMTAIVALDHADTSFEVTVSENAALIGESSANLVQGDTMDLASALRALLVPSGNDAAVAIAECVGAQMLKDGTYQGDDAMAAFVAAMNDKAAELGLADTVYENPHGLDDGEHAGDLHSTALDQTAVARCAMGYPEIRDIVSGGSTTITVKRDGAQTPVDLETTDLLLDMYDYAIGVKTGVTDLAGPSFMGAAEKDGRALYAVVLDCADEYTRFEDAEALFEWAYDHVINLPLAQVDTYATMRKDGYTSDVPVIAEASHYEWIDRTVKATLEDPDASVTVFDLEGNVGQSVELDELHGTVEAGDKVGHITFYQHNQVIAEQDLVACERVEAPNPIDTVAIWWTRLTQGLDETSGRAESKVYNIMPTINARGVAAA